MVKKMEYTQIPVVDFNEKLYADFPTFFEDSFWGVECSSGWFGILYQLMEAFTKVQDLPEDFHIMQIKEKFGGLRVYVSSGSEEVYDLIRKAEEVAMKTCEACGSEAGSISTIGSWMRTLCAPCHKTQTAKRKAQEAKWAKA